MPINSLRVHVTPSVGVGHSHFSRQAAGGQSGSGDGLTARLAFRLSGTFPPPDGCPLCPHPPGPEGPPDGAVRARLPRMSAGPRDTDPKMGAMQVALLRRARTAQRAARARSLSQTAIQLARRAIRRTMPEASEQEVLLRFVAVHYGQKWVERLRARLSSR